MARPTSVMPRMTIGMKKGMTIGIWANLKKNGSALDIEKMFSEYLQYLAINTKNYRLLWIRKEFLIFLGYEGKPEICNI